MGAYSKCFTRHNSGPALFIMHPFSMTTTFNTKMKHPTHLCGILDRHVFYLISILFIFMNSQRQMYKIIDCRRSGFGPENFRPFKAQAISESPRCLFIKIHPALFSNLQEINLRFLVGFKVLSYLFLRGHSRPFLSK